MPGLSLVGKKIFLNQIFLLYIFFLVEGRTFLKRKKKKNGRVENIFFSTNERPGIWSCDLWANERPQNKFHTNRRTNGRTDIATL